jgi:hypothetical protein
MAIVASRRIVRRKRDQAPWDEPDAAAECGGKLAVV